MLLADGFEKAFIGVGRQANLNLAVYDEDKCIEALMNDGCTYEDARDHFEFNVVGSYAGKETPLFLRKADLEDIIDEYAE